MMGLIKATSTYLRIIIWRLLLYMKKQIFADVLHVHGNYKFPSDRTDTKIAIKQNIILQSIHLV